MAKISGIYKIINIINNKIYIGSSCNIKARWQTHRDTLRKNIHHNKHLQKSYNKYGKDNFTFEIIELCDKEFLLIKEQYWLDLLNPTNNKIGYNNAQIAGSCLGIKQSKDACRKKSEISKGKPMNNCWEGRKNTGTCIILIDEFGNCKEIPTITKLIKYLGVSRNTIYRTLKGESSMITKYKLKVKHYGIK